MAGPGRFVRADRRKIGMVFQEYALFPHLTVAANVGFGVGDRSARARRVDETLALVGMASLGGRMPHELSGGQQQRVALARALCPQPAVLLLDEPFSNLDEALRKQVRREVRDILKFTGATAIFVTHDQDEALFMGDRVAVLDQGMLQQVAEPEEIYNSPATRFVAEFIGVADFLPAEYAGGCLRTAAGDVPWPGAPPGNGAELLLRPDDMVLTPSEDGQGLIMERQFLGPTYLYDVALDTGRSVRVMQRHTRRYEVGTKVEVPHRRGTPPGLLRGRRPRWVGLRSPVIPAEAGIQRPTRMVCLSGKSRNLRAKTRDAHGQPNPAIGGSGLRETSADDAGSLNRFVGSMTAEDADAIDAAVEEAFEHIDESG